MIKLSLLNSEDEVRSFPLTQTILLKSTEELELSGITENISLLREPTEQGLLNTSELYNYNIGYIKETFDLQDVTVSQVQDEGFYKLLIKPTTILKPSSSYILFIDKNLSSEKVSIVKTVSKGPSYLELEEYSRLNGDYTIKVVSSSSITSTFNITKFQVTTPTETLRATNVNAKSSTNFLEFEGIKVRVPDKPFGEGEEFQITFKEGSSNLPDNLVVSLYTASTESIKPVEPEDSSHAISNQDILDYYKQKNKVSSVGSGLDLSAQGWEEKEFYVEYLDSHTFILKLNTLVADDIDLENISFRALPAFNRSDLQQLSLYDRSKEYSITHEVMDEKTILFEFKEVL